MCVCVCPNVLREITVLAGEIKPSLPTIVAYISNQILNISRYIPINGWSNHHENPTTNGMQCSLYHCIPLNTMKNATESHQIR